MKRQRSRFAYPPPARRGRRARTGTEVEPAVRGVAESIFRDVFEGAPLASGADGPGLSRLAEWERGLRATVPGVEWLAELGAAFHRALVARHGESARALLDLYRFDVRPLQELPSLFASQWREAFGGSPPAFIEESGYHPWMRAEVRYLRFARRGLPQVFQIGTVEASSGESMVHELGHVVLEILGDLAEQPGAPAAAVAEYQRVLGWLGAPSREAISREQHELFAEALALFLCRCLAPSERLAPLFDDVQRWFRRQAELARSLVGAASAFEAEVAAAAGVGVRAGGRLPASELFRSLLPGAGRFYGMKAEIRDTFERVLATDDEIAARGTACELVGDVFDEGGEALRTESAGVPPRRAERVSGGEGHLAR